MSQEQFAALLPIVSADLIGEITAAQGITESDAIQLLYRSKLYAALEQEETKLWQYSTLCCMHSSFKSCPGKN